MIKIYKYSDKAIKKQFFFSGFLIFSCVLVPNIIFSSVLVFVSILFVKDAIKMKKSVIKLDEDGIKIFTNDKVSKELVWKDMVYVVVKSKKWLIISDDNIKITLTDSIEGLEKLAREIIDYNRKNKKLFVDPSIKQVFGIDIKLGNFDGGNIIE